MAAMLGVRGASEFKAEEAEYHAVVSSGIFPPLSNGARFLEYVVARHFARDLEVNEYSIGVDALGRRKDFDPKQDAIVRVEAHRVRKRLAEYYAVDGAHHHLRLTIPHGSYLPIFVRHDNGVQVVTPPGPNSEPSRRNLALLSAFALLLLVGGGSALLWKSHIGTAIRPAHETGLTPLPETAVPSEVRILAGSRAEYKDRLGQVWSPDRFFTGGQEWTARYRRILRTRDPELFLSARQGREFGYDIPLNPGTYELRLYSPKPISGRIIRRAAVSPAACSMSASMG
jgi:Malectin domain